jgi:hypothetical protein
LEKEKEKEIFFYSVFGLAAEHPFLAQLNSSLVAHLALLSRARPVSFLPPLPAWAEPSQRPGSCARQRSHARR